jgi:dolichyl-phosphate beta-glucosyltransferase
VPPDITLILPAYNEAGRIAGTIAEAVEFFKSRRLAYEIIVAADGDDGTREIVSGLGRSDPAIRAFGAPGRHGKGRGIREAVRMAAGSVIGFADADNKVPIEEYDKLAPFLAGGFQIAIGSRALARATILRSQPWYRRLGGKGFGYLMRAATGLRGIADTQCGFKFFHGDVARRLFALQRIDGYMYDVEILLLAQYLGYRVREVPIRWRDDGDSRLDLVRGNLRNLRDILRLRRRVKAAARGEARA